MKYVLLAPVTVLFVVTVLWPVGELFALSLHATNFITTRWVGLANYRTVVTDPAFLQSLVNSGGYIVGISVLQIGGALVAALLAMELPKRWRDATRVLMWVPLLSAGIIIAQVWRWVFHIDGPANWALGTRIAWFAEGATAIPVISIIVAVATVGGPTIVFLAALLNVDRGLIDAARIDGATTFQIKRRVVLPIIAPIVWAMLLLVIVSAPQVFETIYALAPYDHAATATYRIYQLAFVLSRHGQAAAAAVLLMVVLGGIAYAQRRIVGE